MVNSVLTRLLVSPMTTFFRMGMGGIIPGNVENMGEAVGNKEPWRRDPNWIVWLTSQVLDKMPEKWRTKYDIHLGNHCSL